MRIDAVRSLGDSALKRAGHAVGRVERADLRQPVAVLKMQIDPKCLGCVKGRYRAGALPDLTPVFLAQQALGDRHLALAGCGII